MNTTVNELIPLLDLESEYKALGAEIKAAIGRMVDARQFILGSEVAALEEEFAAYCGARYAVGVNSGTSALHLALLALGVGPGDEVVTTPFTFYATVAAIGYCGATAVFGDIDPVTFNLDPAALEAAITPRTRAILPVHLYGHPADMPAINEIARRHGIPVVEDAAQAHGARIGEQRAGALADIGCFSFYPTKNLGAAGEGGMITTSDPSLAKTARMLRDWGQERKYHPVMKGFNYRLEGLQAAVLRVKLPHLEEWNSARRASARLYDSLLANRAVRLPATAPGCDHVFHLYTVRVPRREAVQKFLAERGVQTAVHYPLPIHLLPAYATARYREGDFPQAEAAAREVLSLPMNPFLTPEQVRRAAEVVIEAAAECDNRS